MTSRLLYGVTLFAFLSLAGCGGGDPTKHDSGGCAGTGVGTGGGAGDDSGGGQFSKVTAEAQDLALKMLD